MSDHCTHIYAHMVWATHRRLPLLTPEVEDRVQGCILAVCGDLDCKPLVIGGTSDHIHLLVRLHPTVSVSALAKRVKGSSSHLVTHELCSGEPFRWQRGYGAFSLGRNQLNPAVLYVRRQKERHAGKGTWAEWEDCGELDD